MKKGVVLALCGLGGSYALKAAKFRRLAAKRPIFEAPISVGTPEFDRLIEVLTGAPIRPGNKLTIFRNGTEIFPAMLSAIRSARRCIDFATFVYWQGAIAPEIADALAERARAGVEVNVLLDAFGAQKMDGQLVELLRSAGASVGWFRPLRWHSLNKLNNRTHRKILVIDGEVGFTGGTGIAEEWTGDCEDADHWRDTHLRVEGPVVRDLFGGFQENWLEATGRILSGAHHPEVAPHQGGVWAQVTRSSASKSSTAAEDLFYAAVMGAQHRLWLTTAYFAPRSGFVAALCEAVSRGVDVRVLTNGPHSDSELSRQAGRVYYERLLEAGVRIFEYQRTMLHAKVMTVDRVWFSVGSINLDNRSFALNDELNLSATDETLAGLLDAHFERDLQDASEADLERWRRRPLKTRAKEWASTLALREL